MQVDQNYDEIYKAHARLVYGFLLKKCHNHDLAEELTQETFVIALEKLHSYDHTCKITTWLCAIANNLLRREQRRKDAAVLKEELAADSKVDWDAVGTLRYVHELSEPYREVIYLRLAANLSFAQIGEIMGKSENWARVCFYRGKTKIKEAMQHETAM